MKKTVEERIQASQERVKKELEKQKSWIAAENARRRKERNSRIFATGAHVEYIAGAPKDGETIEDYKARIGRLLRIGLAADEVLQRDVDPGHFKFFLLNQQERGHFFSRFMDERDAGRDEHN